MALYRPYIDPKAQRGQPYAVRVRGLWQGKDEIFLLQTKKQVQELEWLTKVTVGGGLVEGWEHTKFSFFFFLATSVPCGSSQARG